VLVGDDEHADSLTVIAPGGATGTLPTAGQPGGVADAGGSLAAVVAVGERRVALYDVVAGRKVGETTGGVGPTHVVAEGDLIYVADTQGDAILVYRSRPRFTFLDRANVPGTPLGLALDPRRRELWVTLTETNQLLRMELTANAPRPVAIYPTLRQPNSVAVDQRSGRVFVGAAGGRELQVIGAGRR
jgi:DNA-binding beta-propeller fold protein YncE